MRVIHEVICRKCLSNVGADYIFQIIGANEREYQLKTEYEVSVQLINAYKKNGLNCPVCSSPNIQPMNIKIEDFKLFDFDKIAKRGVNTEEQMFMIVATKKNGTISSKFGGKTRMIKMPFILGSMEDMLDKIDETDNTCFIENTKGNFSFCYSGNYDFNTDILELRLERLFYFGLTKKEIIDVWKKHFIDFSNNVFHSG